MTKHTSDIAAPMGGPDEPIVLRSLREKRDRELATERAAPGYAAELDRKRVAVMRRRRDDLRRLGRDASAAALEAEMIHRCPREAA